MTRTAWDLIDDPALDGQTNMAVDAQLLDEVARSEAPRTILRFYSWVRPTVSLGRNQSIARAVDLEFCAGRGIDVVHRPTGGRAVLHDDELTYAVASNDAAAFDGGSIYGTYRRISEALADGYRGLGVDAVLAPETRSRGRPRGGMDHPCFVSPSRYELLVGGRKVVGSAQRRLRRGFLQHGSMPITCDRELLARATRMTGGGELDREMAGLAECLPERPSMAALVDAFSHAFSERFGVDLERRSRA